ncbi:MAG TPA: type II secretion system major pseudopilin GspG [Geminicoccus sp.]|jgi:general secretion pathway protein G|uniref:type II secretion system major pseudopilin GspG n=1 Tax=Geminicoccus sp. TaxID=2024832 RepID=UPI002E350F83|nr:type II secretion system major pseudopilin GspG [Geminicoccus sp.]HEX2529773.1 type II secretion system major pseudopilin GspG [Geminicoccus sp.]
MSSTRRRHASAEAGFTLIELLVVLVILGLLAALAGPRVLGYLSSARSDTAKLQIENLSQALELYKLDNGAYPSTAQGLAALVAAPSGAPSWRGPYLTKAELPKDPWGRDYVYRSPGQQGPFDLGSLGSDGTPGGQGDAADVGNIAR